METRKKPKNDLNIKIIPKSSHLFQAEIKVASTIISKIYEQILDSYKKSTSPQGFNNKNIPLEYIKENYQKEIEWEIKNFLFKHFVFDFLMEEIINKKIHLTNYPRLVDIITNQNDEIIFIFDLSIAEPIEIKEWKNFIFRPPKRKRYKDLDKQVTLFLKKQISLFKKHPQNIIQENDWVCFEAIPLDKNKKQLLDNHKKIYWLRVSNKYIKKPFHSSLLNKKIGDSFITNNLAIKNEFSPHNEEENHHLFFIKIKNITKGTYFCLDSFRNNFKLKSKTEVHKKLIEVFSYRNDISQRKAIIEELFHILLSKHRFEVAKHFVIRRQEDILNMLKTHPDYQVYKTQEDFMNNIETLAEKQLKEEILIDQLAYKENIKVDHKDIQSYLYLFNNNRLKEFVYFRPILEKIEDSDKTLQTGILKQSVLREKTLNYIIHILTK
ncbi:hypothetical protein GF322_01100 [Candidatus Dependentiae bacterium]|nr:hypothetical protein [Candidatus Dependentiae bacterium]